MTTPLSKASQIQVDSVFEISSQTLPFEHMQWGLTGLLANFSESEDKHLCFCIPSQTEATQALNLVEQFLRQHNVEQYEKFKIAFTEALSNALYHAQGLEKGPLQKTPLHTSVECELGIDDNAIYACIRDYSGSLTVETIQEKCAKNAVKNPLNSIEGGRGLYLMAVLVDELIIHIAPQRQTEIILVNKKQNLKQNSEASSYKVRVITTHDPIA